MSDEELSRGLLLALEAGPFAQAADSWLMPMLRRVGEAWAQGRLTSGQEHVISAAVLRRLAIAYERLAVPVDATPVLVGLPTGSRHEIGAFTFALLLRQAGYDTVYLGPDLPTDSWLHAVDSYRPAAAVLSVLTDGHAEASATLRALHAAHPALPVFVGGPFAGEVPPRVRVLPSSFAAAFAAFALEVPVGAGHGPSA